MDLTPQQKLENLSQKFNELSEHFIKFSLAYNDVQESVKQLAEDHPSLFNS